MDPIRCGWLNDHPLYIQYHDEEWGLPVEDDHKWFEFITLDAFQAGLSWFTILKKRENFRQAFAYFDPQKVATFGETEFNALMQNAGIVRNRLKIQATIQNASAFLALQAKYSSFNEYIWQFTDGKTIVNQWENIRQVPARTEISDAMSKSLQKEGFRFVGSTICYAFMQAAGMVNDHTTDCFRHKVCAHHAKK